MRADAARDGRWRDFSLVVGGPLVGAARAVGLISGSARYPREQLHRIGLSAAAIAWVPLLVLSALDGTLTGKSAVPFLFSIGTHVRFLVAVPLFFATERLFDHRVAEVIRQLADNTLASRAELPHFEAALERARQWRDAWYTEAAIVAIATVFILTGVRSDVAEALSAWRVSGGRLTPAGWWYAFVSIPIFQFLFWRWCARLLIWWQLLWRIARLDLRLIPIHPDRAGGLGMLGVTHVALVPLAFAFTAINVGSHTEEILFGSATVQQFIVPIAGAVAFTTILTIAPLLTFTPRLFAMKQDGILTYGALAEHYVRAFEDKWIGPRPPPDEPLLGSADIQSLADLSNSFGVVQTIRPIPITPLQMFGLVLAGLAPALPLVFFVVPLDELIMGSVKTLLNL